MPNMEVDRTGTDFTLEFPIRPERRRGRAERDSESGSDLVGRTEELQLLSRRLSDALSGRPSVIHLQGEAGIGKTRLARQVITDAARLGFDVAVGRCDPNLDLPYMPFLDDLFVRLASVSGDPALSAQREILADLRGWAAGTHEGQTAGAAVIHAIAMGFVALTRNHPLLVFVDDVHWADPSSADLLCHLVRTVADASLREAIPLVMLLAQRPPEPGLPPSRLDPVRREHVTWTLELGGLSEFNVITLVKSHGVDKAPRDWLFEVYKVSRGNPLFVTEISRELRSKDRVAGSTVETIFAAPLPSGIGAAIEANIAALSAPCREFLGRLAILGQFDTQLSPVLGYADEGALVTLAEEARARGLVDGGIGAWRFSHPLYRFACEQQLRASDRQRFHALVARALLQSREPTPSGGPPLIAAAHHLAAAGDFADPSELLSIGLAAGDAALKLFAWQEAARFYEAALAASNRVPGAGVQTRIRLLNGAGYAREHNGEPGVALGHFETAVGLIASVDDPDLVASVWMNKLETELVSVGARPAIDTGPLERMAASLESSAPSTAARVYANLAQCNWACGRIGASRDAARSAIDIGSPVGDHRACEAGHRALAMTEWITLDLDSSMERLERALAHAEASHDPKVLTGPLMRIPLNLFWMGRIAEAEEAVDQARRVSRELNYTLENGLFLAARAMSCASRGRFNDVESVSHEALELEQITGYPWATPLVLPTLAAARAAQGDSAGAEEVLERWIPTGGASVHALSSRLVRHQLQLDRGERWTVERAFDEHPVPSDTRWRQFGGDAAAGLLIDVASRLNRPDLAVGAIDAIEHLHGNGQLFTTTMAMFLPRLLGLAMELRGEHEAAAEALDSAIGAALRIGAHAEATRAQCALARILATMPSGVERARARAEHAIRFAAGLGLRPIELESLAIRDSLSGRTAPISTTRRNSENGEPDGVAIESVVILFTDIVDSSRLTEELGDWVFRERARALDNDLRAIIAQAAGRLVEGITMGDGLVADFTSAKGAMACALQCQAQAMKNDLSLHVGLHAGDVIREQGNIFGGAVNIAARVCALAPAGDVVVSQTVRELARTSVDAEFEDLGDFELKGIVAPVRLFRATSRTAAVPEITSMRSK